MKNTRPTFTLTRRSTLKALAGTGALLAAPAIIGRASIASAQEAFAGEELIVVSWSGNYEQIFRETVIEPFNDKYGTRAETVGGWDQVTSQIAAAPADNPPFDVTIAEEYASSAGLAQGLYEKVEKSKFPNLDAVHPWFYEIRKEDARDYGVPWGGGSSMLLIRASLGIEPTSWELLWDDRLANKVTADGAAWWWTLGMAGLLDDRMPGLDEMYEMSTAEGLYERLDLLKIGKWFRDGAEQANLLNQEEVDAAMTYASDAQSYMLESPGEYVAAVPKEGGVGWTDWFFKIRGTRHGELADFFMNYLLEKETQDRFLAKSAVFMSRNDVTAPPHWENYPQSNEDFRERYRIITMEGWDKLMADYQSFDDRMKLTITRTTGG